MDQLEVPLKLETEQQSDADPKEYPGENSKNQRDTPQRNITTSLAKPMSRPKRLITKHTSAINFNPAGKTSGWKNDEKVRLFRALKKYGHLDLHHLRKAVPNKTSTQIYTYLHYWAKVARDEAAVEFRKKSHERKPNDPIEAEKLNFKVKAPLDQWLQLIEEAIPPEVLLRTKNLARAFYYISLYEPQPDPEECDGVDFRQLYDFLYRVLNGYPYKTMNLATTSYLIKTFTEMSRHIRERNYHNFVNIIDEVRTIHYVKKENLRQYRGKQPDIPSLQFKGANECLKVIQEPGFNPLGMSLDTLKKIQNNKIVLSKPRLRFATNMEELEGNAPQFRVKWWKVHRSQLYANHLWKKYREKSRPLKDLKTTLAGGAGKDLDQLGGSNSLERGTRLTKMEATCQCSA
uniref:Myb-like domain-containing protein n=1 Tax=Timema monikensis TaxID=170555 RepID=A0A7R9HI16_9NEOP|nr:unnamed protein product [Timema monikensis]